jgi:HAD superfamily hydrolase (TIGR01458 family)
MAPISNIQGLLFDLDGVLYIGAQPIPGAIEAVARVRASGLPCRFVTNTSTLSQASLRQKLAVLGFDIPSKEIVSAPQAAVLYLRNLGAPVCKLLLAEDVKRDFGEFYQSDEEAQYIVVGDIGGAWNYAMMNQVFARLLAGAQLIAIHKNRFWQTEQGLQMDIGGFVTALEYASGTKATLIGKPSETFYRMALQEMGLPTGSVAMIGDDIDADVGGAQQAGLMGVLVKTGKYREAYAADSAVKPQATLDSVADLPALLGIGT